MFRKYVSMLITAVFALFAASSLAQQPVEKPKVKERSKQTSSAKKGKTSRAKTPDGKPVLVDESGKRYLLTDDGKRFVVDQNGTKIQVDHGAVAEVSYYSKALKRFRRMHVYTPPGYEKDGGQYPVFYLLHGAFDCDDSWTTLGRAGFILDNLIAAGKAKPMVVVMPAGHTGPFNFGAPRPPTDEFMADFVGDVMPYAESHYCVRTDRAHRALAGLSMGGGHTLAIAAVHLEQFSYLGVFSSGVFGITGRGPGSGAPGPSFEEQRKRKWPGSCPAA